ncbi:MAG TPA: pyridoxamine 5'-phosphate oxidase [Candidatus Limnocylindrales bacterium]|nr:pyridoxamine 5'-phosphate oxidase [Candidatus Limnocylindrales bacterium]
MSISDLRREYTLAGLRRQDLDADPMVQFRQWFEQASGARTSGRWHKFLVRLYKRLLLIGGVDVVDINAMTLATVDPEGKPSARTVLLKGVDERGFIFFTNYTSRKGRELSANPNAALVCYWPELERQVTIAGTVTKVPEAESDAYFASRPYGSRIGAWSSDQSEVVRDRAELEQKWKQFEHQFPAPDVPRPAHWGGYVLSPSRLEFWQGRPNRLHDRFRYTRKEDNSWVIERLSP